MSRSKKQNKGESTCFYLEQRHIRWLSTKSNQSEVIRRLIEQEMQRELGMDRIESSNGHLRLPHL